LKQSLLNIVGTWNASASRSNSKGMATSNRGSSL
jgi:hypothetical protein